MTDKLLKLDREIFLYLNGKHVDWLDSPMFIFTHTLSWMPLFLVLLYFIAKEYRQQTWIFVIGIALAIALADQITSSVMKPYFIRWRPSHDPSLTGMVHLVKNYVGGKYGFASSHAANTFAVATFIYSLLKKRRRWISLIFIWAIFVCYTRIYLGVHYPGDLIAGALVGAFSGWVMVKISLIARQKIYPEIPPDALSSPQ